MLGDWEPTDKDCPDCGSSNTVKNPDTGAVWCKDCDMEYVVKYE
jgi:transposase-like protein